LELGHKGRVIEMLGKECLKVMDCREVGKSEKEWWMVVWKWKVAEILGKECLEVMGCKVVGKLEKEFWVVVAHKVLEKRVMGLLEQRVVDG